MKTVTFLSLFLGLVWGRPMVELEAVDGTTRIEVSLDGEVVSVITGGPPWKSPLGLGSEVAPHHLEAVALDPDGGVLGRAEQWLNLPRGLAEVQILVDAPQLSAAEPGGEPVEGAAARIEWTAVRHSRAEDVTVTFDGAPLAAPDPKAVRLPPFDPGVLHLLSAEVTFPDGSSARADRAFGGAYGEELTTELTAVPVRVEDRRRLRDLSEIGDWLRVGGRPASVVAMDQGKSDLFAVIDPEARHQRLVLLVEMARRMGQRDARLSRSVDPETGETTFRAHGIRSGRNHPLQAVGLRAGDRLYLVRSHLDTRNDGLRLFALSDPLSNELGGTAWQLARHRIPHDPQVPQQVADSVATVGLWATGRSRPRVVILVLGPGSTDESDLDPGAVRRYLDRIGVPLSVAYVEAERPLDAEDGRTVPRGQRVAAVRARWGDDVVDVAGAADWIRYLGELRDELDHQRILWVRGWHLPHEVELDPASPRWLSLLGGAAP